MCIIVIIFSQVTGLRTKELLISEFYKDKNDFEKTIDLMKNVQFEEGEVVVDIRGKKNLLAKGGSLKLIQKYDLDLIFVSKENNDAIEVNFAFPEVIKGYEYAGIYYNSDPEYATKLSEWNEYDKESDFYIYKDSSRERYTKNFRQWVVLLSMPLVLWIIDEKISTDSHTISEVEFVSSKGKEEILNKLDDAIIVWEGHIS